MNVAVINHYAGSIFHGMEYRPYYLAREWVRSGHDVLVIGGSYSHLRTVQPRVLGSRPIWESISDVQYVWLRTPSYKGNGVKRALSMLVFVVRLFLSIPGLLRRFSPDVVVASSTYPFDIFPAFVMAKLSRAVLVFEVHDLWPLSLIEIGRMSRFHPFVLAVKVAELCAYRLADRVVSMLPCARGYMESQGMKPEKYLHVPNGIDLREWAQVDASVPKDHTEKIEAFRRNGEFVVLYAGSLGAANAMDLLLDAAARMVEASVRFVLVGQGQEKSRLQARAEALGLRNLVFMPPVKKAEIPALLAVADCLYIGGEPHSIYRFGISPNKMFDYMMAAKPIVCAIRAGNDMVKDAQCGISCGESPEEIVQAISSIGQMSESERKRLGQNGYAYVTSQHSYETLAQKFLSVC